MSRLVIKDSHGVNTNLLRIVIQNHFESDSWTAGRVFYFFLPGHMMGVQSPSVTGSCLVRSIQRAINVRDTRGQNENVTFKTKAITPS